MTLPLKRHVSWTLRCVTGAIAAYVPKGRDAFAFRVSSLRRNNFSGTVWPFCQKFKPRAVFVRTNSRHCKVEFSFVIKCSPRSVLLCNFRYEIRHEINLKSMSLVLFSFLNLTRRVLIWLHCYPCKIWGTYHIKERQFLFTVDRDPRPFLISMMLQIFLFIVKSLITWPTRLCFGAESRWLSFADGLLRSTKSI